jgi:hypothetical protein
LADRFRPDLRLLAATAAATVIFCSYLIWSVPHSSSTRPELRQGPAEMLVAAAYPLAGLAFLAMAGTRAARALHHRPRHAASARDGHSRARSS